MCIVVVMDQLLEMLVCVNSETALKVSGGRPTAGISLISVCDLRTDVERLLSVICPFILLNENFDCSMTRVIPFVCTFKERNRCLLKFIGIVFRKPRKQNVCGSRNVGCDRRSEDG